MDWISWSDAFKQTMERSVRDAILGTSNGCSLMHILAGCNKWALITVLLDQEAALDSCLDYSQFTPLAIAIYYRSFQAANVLLDRKSFIGVKCFGQKNFTLAYLASKTSSTRMKNLISNLPYWQEGKLSSALQEGRLREAKDLVRKGVNVNFQYGKRLITPLLHVCECHPNETELITLLLEAGAIPNVSVDGKLRSSKKTRITMTPLVYAIQGDNLEVVKLLVERGANPPGYVLQKPWKMGSGNVAMSFIISKYGKQ